MVRGPSPRGLVGAAVALFAVALTLGLPGCGRSASHAPVQPSGATPGGAASLPAGFDTKIERVVDGDTLVVAGGHRVRLIGVDTPETKDPRKPVQCFGEQASAYVSSLLREGEGVRLVGDVEERDVYGRTLAYVYRLADGLFVNAALVREGYAHVLTIPPNVAHADEFVTLARGARERGRGLWSSCPLPDGAGRSATS